MNWLKERYGENSTPLGLAILALAGGGFVLGLVGIDPFWATPIAAVLAAVGVIRRG